MKLLLFALQSLYRLGELTLIDHKGKTHLIAAKPVLPIPPLTVRLRDKRWAWKLILNPTLAGGEAYMAGDLVMEQGQLYDLLALTALNLKKIEAYVRLKRIFRWFQNNTRPNSVKNVAHHYDLSRNLYHLFLDRDQQYSCAYYRDRDYSLEAAQEAKKRHIASKLLLKSGQRVLDIGCGWGGLAITLAKLYHVEVVGITLSVEQLKVAQERVKQEGLQGRVSFRLQDYRDIDETFDRVVSVGMFEHVGLPFYSAYFASIERLLTKDGVALLHSIGRSYGSGITNGWIRKYIFPGGYAPALSEALVYLERSGLMVTDIEILRDHYALTLKQWVDNFQKHRHLVSKEYDERFCRLWEFYLEGSRVFFEYQGGMVFQIQMAKHHGVVPITRDYITHRDISQDEQNAAE